MEELKIRRELLAKSLIELKRAIEQMDTYELSQIYDILRDATIKRFEICFTDFWEFLRIYLESKDSIIKAPTPDKIFLNCLDNSFITKDQFIKLTSMDNDAKKAQETRDQEVLDAINEKIPSHYETMKKIKDNLSI